MAAAVAPAVRVVVTRDGRVAAKRRCDRTLLEEAMLGRVEGEARRPSAWASTAAACRRRATAGAWWPTQAGAQRREMRGASCRAPHRPSPPRGRHPRARGRQPQPQPPPPRRHRRRGTLGVERVAAAGDDAAAASAEAASAAGGVPSGWIEAAGPMQRAPRRSGAAATMPTREEMRRDCRHRRHRRHRRRGGRHPAQCGCG